MNNMKMRRATLLRRNVVSILMINNLVNTLKPTPRMPHHSRGRYHPCFGVL